MSIRLTQFENVPVVQFGLRYSHGSAVSSLPLCEFIIDLGFARTAMYAASEDLYSLE
jgi:hypothetical protein